MAAPPIAVGAGAVQPQPTAYLTTLLLLLGGTAALDNGLLRTPPMGFSDACLGGGESTRLGAAQLQAVATDFISSGLAALGYTHMNLGE
jgi:alpha-galactosidase|eukprot:COSAG01_NODE_737_length_13945_cov_10.858082_9_plen_89_part_00